MDNKKLLYVFLGLLALFVVLRLFSSRSDDRSFRSELVSIDTARVTSVSLYPRSDNREEIRFTRTGGSEWTVEQGGVRAEADAQAVRSMLGQLLQVSPERMAARRPERWSDFQVSDSAATRMVVEEDGQTTLDLMIGRFSVQQNIQEATSYVRLRDEEEVYATRGLLSLSFDRGFNEWRNRTFVQLQPEDLSRVAFEYPADSGFVLARRDSAWLLGDAPADSASVAQYLSRLRNLTTTSFVNDVGAVPSDPVFQVTLEGNNMSPLVVRGFTRQEADSTYLLHSSLNPDVYFSSDASGVFAIVFAGRQTFLE